jgi:hypothetical protein
LTALADSYRHDLEGGATMNILPAAPPATVSIAYTDVRRPVAPETKGFLWQFEASSGEADFASRFNEELLFQEGDVSYWVPLQEPPVPALILSSAQY